MVALHRKRRTSLFASALLLSFRLFACAPEVTSISPQAVVPGKITTLTLSGSNLAAATNLWTSFGGTAHRATAANSHVVFELSCPPEASGVQAIQVLGPEGSSSFHLLLIDPLAAQSHSGTNHSIKSALHLSPPVAIDSSAQPEQIDFYRFTARAAQSCSLEVIAHRIGSQMDPVLRVLNSAGKELAFCDDEPGVWRDARFRFTAPVDGEYILAVHDIGYAGGRGHQYRLRVSNDPLVWYTYPLTDPAAAAVQFEQIGEAARIGPAAASPANPPANPFFSSSPLLLELEPNDTPSQAQFFGFPAVLNGKINRAGDVDLFSFDAVKGQKLVFQGQTRTLGSPCDLVLQLKNADGVLVAQSDSNAAADASLTNTIPEPGRYWLEVRELSGAAPENVPYRIKSFVFEPGVALSTENNRLDLRPGASATVKVSCLRYDYSGPITLELDPPINAVTLEKNVIAENKSETDLKITLPTSSEPGEYVHFRINAHAGNSATIVSTLPALRKLFPLMLNPPPHLDGLLSVAVLRAEIN